MNLIQTACLEFEQSISQMVDQELPDSSASELVDHLEQCSGCRSYMDDLRELAQVHRTLVGSVEAESAVDDLVDRHALFASVTRTLVGEKCDELARLLYELGKAYVLLGNRQGAATEQHRSVLTVTRPVEIRSADQRGRRLAREGEELCSVLAYKGGESGSLFRRSRRILRSQRAGALTTGHRLLQEALVIRPDLDEARLYLGFHHLVVGRLDRARVEFRRVYREGRDPVHRMMALQFLGNVHSNAGDVRKAIECYEEVVASGLIESEPRFFTSLLNLAVNCAKAGMLARCVQLFDDVATRFPDRIGQIRELISRKQNFLVLLQSQSELREALNSRVPVLFAA